MKKFILIILINLFIFKVAKAETFIVALKKAYNNNPELNAERQSLKISEQELNISKSSYLPTVTLSGSKSDEETNKLSELGNE